MAWFLLNYLTITILFLKSKSNTNSVNLIELNNDYKFSLLFIWSVVNRHNSKDILKWEISEDIVSVYKLLIKKIKICCNEWWMTILNFIYWSSFMNFQLLIFEMGNERSFGEGYKRRLIPCISTILSKKKFFLNHFLWFPHPHYIYYYE